MTTPSATTRPSGRLPRTDPRALPFFQPSPSPASGDPFLLNYNDMSLVCPGQRAFRGCPPCSPTEQNCPPGEAAPHGLKQHEITAFDAIVIKCHPQGEW